MSYSYKGLLKRVRLLRKLADNYEDDDPLKKLHQTGIQLTFSEPILLFDGATKTGNIHWLCWDGEPLADVIAPDITAFFEHWLAAGCFYQGDFKAYWEVVKDIVPIHIAEDKNLWLNFYNKQYKPVDEDAEKAQEAMAAASNAAYQQGREGIELWRSGEEEEAVKLFAKAIDFGLKNDDEHPVTQTICNHAYLCSEADRQEEGFQVMSNFYNDNKSFAENAPGVLSLLGQYYYENNNLDEAYKLCLSAVEKAPMFGLGYYRMACLYIRLNKLDDALSNVIKAAKCDKSLCEDLAADTDFEKIKDRLEFKKAVGIAT